MINLVLAEFDYKSFLPFTFTRPTGAIRIGIFTIEEKWNSLIKCRISHITQSYLSEKFPLHAEEVNHCVNSSVIPTKKLARKIIGLKPGESLVHQKTTIAFCCSKNQLNSFKKERSNKGFSEVIWEEEIKILENIWDIFLLNDWALKEDYKQITSGRKSQALPKNCIANNRSGVFIEKGAHIGPCFINAETGPVYIGKEAEVMEGCMIRGPFSLGHNSTLKMGAKIYGATTIGPHCKVGGEISNSVIFGYSNKAHDGFLGNSVIGEWCNLGADTNNSNLKNNYSEVKVWSYEKKDFVPTGLQFCGLFMGDHSKSSINTMFNTGTVVGVCANIFQPGFPPKYIPSFSWGNEKFALDKAIETAKAVYNRRHMDFTENDESIFRYLHS